MLHWHSLCIYLFKRREGGKIDRGIIGDHGYTQLHFVHINDSNKERVEESKKRTAEHGPYACTLFAEHGLCACTWFTFSML